MTIWDYIESKRQEAVEECKSRLWHDAQGDDLPDIDKLVIVLDKRGRVSYGHRPDKKGYLVKSLVTGNIEKCYPYTYDKGGWNIPDVKFWLNVELPNLKE